MQKKGAQAGALSFLISLWREGASAASTQTRAIFGLSSRAPAAKRLQLLYEQETRSARRNGA